MRRSLIDRVGKKLPPLSVGGRGSSDFSYCCYLSDLAVDKDYQKSGIGKELIGRIRNIIGEEVALILLSAPNAMDYYPKVGFDKVDNGFIIRRKR
jgi:predicted N-acetyltransferase YhbS